MSYSRKRVSPKSVVKLINTLAFYDDFGGYRFRGNDMFYLADYCFRGNDALDLGGYRIRGNDMLYLGGYRIRGNDMFYLGGYRFSGNDKKNLLKYIAMRIRQRCLQTMAHSLLCYHLTSSS